MNYLVVDVGGTAIKHAMMNERYEMWAKAETNGLDDLLVPDCDLDIVQLYTEIFSDDATATYNYDRLYNKRTVTEMLKFERAGMIGMGHILDFDNIRFEGDLAYAHVYRAALNAVPSAWFAGEGKHDNWYNARYDLVFRKETDGVWRILKLEYFQDMIKVPLAKGIFVVETGA